MTSAEREADLTAFIAAHNGNPKPYKWVKSTDEILAAVKCFYKKTMSKLQVTRDSLKFPFIYNSLSRA